MGQSQKLRGDDKSALIAYRRALKLNPSDRNIQEIVGNMESTSGSFPVTQVTPSAKVPIVQQKAPDSPSQVEPVKATPVEQPSPIKIPLHPLCSLDAGPYEESKDDSTYPWAKAILPFLSQTY